MWFNIKSIENPQRPRKISIVSEGTRPPGRSSKPQQLPGGAGEFPGRMDKCWEMVGKLMKLVDLKLGRT